MAMTSFLQYGGKPKQTLRNIHTILDDKLIPLPSISTHPSTHQSTHQSTDTHKADTHKADTHKTDTHTADTHTADTHTADTHKADTHTADTHKADTHTADRHKADRQDADMHKADRHKADTHKVNGKGVDTHKADRQDADEKVVDEKVMDEKVMDEKVMDEKVVNEKVMDEKVMDEKVMDEKVVEGLITYTRDILRDMKFRIDYLHVNDEYLIAEMREEIITDIMRYISNVRSDKMANYAKYYNLIYTKYSGRKYKIETPANEIIVYTADKKKIIIHLHKPEYLSISLKIAEYKDEIAILRFELDNKYYSIMRAASISPSEKDAFIAVKTKLITTLKKYYTIIMYQHLVASRTSESTQETITILHNEYLKILKDKSGTIDSIAIVDTKARIIPLSLHIDMQQYDIAKLNQYNELIAASAASASKDYADKIRAYITMVKPVIEEKKTTALEYIYRDLIVVSLPKIIINI